MKIKEKDRHFTSEPRLQNLNGRTELGRQIREAFFPKIELNVDYKSIEEALANQQAKTKS